MKLRIVLAVAVAVALALSGCGSGSATTSTTAVGGSPQFVLGSWSGTLHQSGVPSFRVRSVIRSLTEPKKNDVAYSGIRCRGNWRYLGRAEGVYRFREVIDRGGGGLCKGVGIVTLAPLDPDTAAYVFRGGGVVSRGLLRRG